MNIYEVIYTKKEMVACRFIVILTLNNTHVKCYQTVLF